MRKALLVLIAISVISNSLFAQYYTNQNKVWAFSVNGGIDFGSGMPAVFNTSIYTYEGSASVSDVNGNLLFYTDGNYVFNRYGDMMPSGNFIAPFSTMR